MTGAPILQLHGAVVDMIYRVRAVPRAGEEAVVTGFSVAPGGGFNTVYAARRWGAEVAYAGAIGSGPLGALVARALDGIGVPALLPPDDLRDQGCCTVMVDDAAERTFVAADGAEGHLAPGTLESLPADRYPVKIVSGYTLHYAGARDALAGFLSRDPRATGVIFDPSPVVAHLDPAALKAALGRAAWVSANAQEAAILTGIADPADAAHALAQGRAGGAVVRDGARGCIVALPGGTRPEVIAPHPVRPVDTTGAGDTHIGTFAAALAEGRPAAEAARIANVAAALATLRHGPATAPERREVEAIITKNRTNPAQTATPIRQRGTPECT